MIINMALNVRPDLSKEILMSSSVLFVFQLPFSIQCHDTECHVVVNIYDMHDCTYDEHGV